MYTTTDFYSACILRACRIQLTDIIKMSSKTVEFVFRENEKECNRVLKSHWDGELILPTKDVVGAISELKTRLHTVLSNDKAD
jgi:hypothetical protein